MLFRQGSSASSVPDRRPDGGVCVQRTMRRGRLFMAHKAEFERRRRHIRMSFERLFELFAKGLSVAEVARRAGVHRSRLNRVYTRYFGPLLGTATALERRREQERARREKTAKQVIRVVARDRVINAIKSSAAEANSRHTVEPIALDRSGPVTKRYRHRAVLVDGWDVEQVHHLRNVKSAHRAGGIAYTVTTLHRGRLARGHWTIFFVDAAGFPRRVIRSKNSRLLNEFFADGQTRVSVYIPLNGRPSNPRYAFLRDEDRWS
jgi:AraC-like DNA-binding protein